MYFRLLISVVGKVVGLNVYNSDNLIVKQFGLPNFDGRCNESDYAYRHNDADEFFAKLELTTTKLGLVEL